MTAGSIGPRHPAPPWMDPEDAEFLRQKRLSGIPDSQIAKMLGCTVERLQSSVVAPDDPTVAEVARQGIAAERASHRAAVKRQSDRDDQALQRQRDRERRARLRGQ